MSDYEKPDEEIVRLVSRGDGRAMDFLLNKYKQMVKIKARAYFIIGADQEDLIQEGMIGLYQAVRDYDPGKNAAFSTFADLCVTRRILTAIKLANRGKHSPLNNYISTDNNFDDLSGNASPEDILISREGKIQLELTLKEELSKLEYEVLSSYLIGKPYAEIARELGRDGKAIDNALQRIRKKINKYY